MKSLDGEMIALYLIQYNGGSHWNWYLPKSLAVVVAAKMLQGRNWLRESRHWLNR